MTPDRGMNLVECAYRGIPIAFRTPCGHRGVTGNWLKDWTGGMTPSRRIPVIEEAKPKRPLLSADGIRRDAAIAALVLIAILLAVLLLADVASIGNSGRAIRKLNSSIQDLQTRNERIQAEIELNTDSASVCTEAA